MHKLLSIVASGKCLEVKKRTAMHRLHFFNLLLTAESISSVYNLITRLAKEIIRVTRNKYVKGAKDEVKLYLLHLPSRMRKVSAYLYIMPDHFP